MAGFNWYLGSNCRACALFYFKSSCSSNSNGPPLCWENCCTLSHGLFSPNFALVSCIELAIDWLYIDVARFHEKTKNYCYAEKRVVLSVPHKYLYGLFGSGPVRLMSQLMFRCLCDQKWKIPQICVLGTFLPHPWKTIVLAGWPVNI